MLSIQKILIANRGEIAVRVIRTCKAMGIHTVAVHSTPDTESLHVLLADEAVHLKGVLSSETYLDMDSIIQACKATGAQAVHPGYGFLSENASFARKCALEGIIFIGPDPEAIRIMGDKTEARKLVEKHGIPLPPGTTHALSSFDDARTTAKKIGFPVLIKAAAGGGGKGMRVVHHQHELKNAVIAAQSEAKSAFGDNRVYIEKYLEEPRHIEVQIMADKHGNVLHFYDRECSIQRRHQKVIEEAPSPFLDDELRDAITKTAVQVAKTCAYVGAGTVEFLADKHRNFYFLEMNTRLQVEHPVTEMITGYDLVELQIRVARGEELHLHQSEIHIKGHAIECRICSEDPSENFLPSTGTLTRLVTPAGPGVRVDAGVREGQEVTMNYDSLIAKLLTHGNSREVCIRKMEQALSDFEISGIRTTIPFCLFAMQHPDFRSGYYDTHFIKDNFTPDTLLGTLDQQEITDMAAAMYQISQNGHSRNSYHTENTDGSLWWKNRSRQ